MKYRLIILFAILGLLTCGENTFAQQNAERHSLRKEAPTAALARPIGKPAPAESLRVAISLPLRNREALDGLLKRLYDPGSPDFRQYLTPEQFTENFGPTEEDYQRVINFAQSFGLSIEQKHDNRLLLDVRGRVADLERAFHVSLRTYQHPKEARQFRAPEAAPWVDSKLPIQEVTGLSDYVLLRPTAHRKPVKTQSGAAGGSSPIAGDFIGQDFRNAYAPGVSLTGAGQRVGLFEADGYYSADIDNYEAYAGQSSVTLQNVLIDGFNGLPGALNPEVAADIEMAIAMAPGLASVVVFECTNTVSSTNSGGTEVQYWLDTLDRMASSNQIKQFSSSWGYVTADPTQDPNTAFDAAFKQMATQGQSFFQASGDGDAWATPIWVPADSPYVTSVGGTMLNMNGLGASFASETVWNSGLGPPGWPITANNYWGSGGGVSTVYPIPYWQTNVSMTANLGSTTSRNIPDVALTATNIFITADNGEFGGYFGTSCSAPLWAGYNALINQQAANSNKPPVGFINPAIYALGQGPNYSLCFHDTTTGSNTFAGSPSKYFATSGFDLCTGWGTPTGSNLINALAGVYQPTITTQPNSQTIGVGGSVTFTVAATGVTPFSYQWQFGGTNIASATQTSFSLSNLVQTNGGNYTVVVTNQWGSVTSIVAVLTVSSGTPVVTWANPAAITYGTPLSGVQLNATANVPGTFVYTPASGTVLNAGNNTLTAVFTPTDTVDYSKATNTVSLVVSPATLTITANNKTKTYGQTVTFAGTEFTKSGLVNGNTVSSVTLASSGAAATAGVTGSPYSIVPSAAVGTGLANYNITYVNGALTVSKAALSVTANAQSKIYGQTVTFGSGSTLFTSSGLQNGETIGTVTLAVSSGGGAATASVSGSPYTITPSAATGGTFSSGNYTITYHTASLTVSRAALSITASAENKSYGQTVTFGSGSALFTSSGLQNGETIGSVTLAVSGSGGAATATVAASPYTITPSAATGGTFTANNYSVSYNSGSLTVNRATLTITASAESKTYGQTVTFGSGSTLFTSSGLQNGETVGTVTLGVSGSGGLATAPVSSSPYAITPSAATGGTFAANNYSITYNPGNLTVNPAALTVTANAQSKVYGQTVATGSGSGQFTSSALQNSETIGSVTLSVNNSGAAANAPVSGSPYTITPSAATGGTFSAGNYTITYATASLTVSAVGLTITASAESKAYGQTVAFGAGSGQFTSSGLQNGETIGSVTLGVSGNGGAATALVSGSPYLITPSSATGGTFTPGNYSITYANGPLTVNSATLTITASAQSKTYGQAVSFGSGSGLFSSAGLQNGETIGTVTLSVNNNGGTATAPVSGSPYIITPSAATGGTFAPGNYSISYATANLSVGAAALTITANAASKSYGQTATFGSGSGQFTSGGLQNGETIGSVTLAVSGNGGAPTAPVSGSPYAISPSAATGGTFNSGNYSITYAVGNLTVSPAGLTVTANNQGKTYGQAVAFGSGSALFTSSALQNGETIGSVTLSVNNNGGAANAPVSGSPYVITPSAAAGGTFSPGNYSIAYAGGSLTVNPAALTITASSRSKTYGQTVTFAGTEFATLGLLNSDSVGGVTLSSSGAAATAGVAGSPYSIVPSGASGTGLGNYTISYNSGTLTVNRAGLTVTANNRSKTYGQTVSFAGTEFTTLGLLNGDTVTSASISSSGAAATAAVSGSPYAIVPSAATGTGLGNYTINYGNGTLTINAATLSITANNRSKTYGQTVTFAGTEFTTIGLLNSDSVGGVTLSSSGAAATATVAGSPYAIVPSAATGTGLGNYLINYGSGTLTINAATLSITANNRSKTYGQTVTFAGTEFTTIGLLNSDSVGGVTLSSSGAATTAAVAGSPYSIVPSAATGTGLGNYLINYGSGTLTVNRAGLTVTANNRSKTYGQTVTFAGTEFTTLGLLNSDSVGGVTLSSSGAAATAAVAGSPYSIAPSAATGTGLGNYTINYGNGTLTINAATLSITANNRTKTYGQTVTFAGTEFTTLGLLNSDSVGAVTLSSSGAAATAAVSGSPYAIVPSAATGTGLGNYTINYGNGTLTINPATLSITANNRSKTYGQTVTFAGTEFTTLGLLNSDTVSSVTLSSLGASSSAAAAGSPYAIVPSAATGTGLGNYTISYGNGTLTINPATLSITANNRSKTYGQTVTFAGTEFTTIGLLNSDTVSSVTLSSLGASASASVAGSPYAIVPSAATGTGLGNYTINYGNGTLTINPATLSITANNRSKTYGQTVTFAGTEFTTLGLLNSDSVGGVTLSSSGAAATATVAGSPYAIVPSAAAGTGLNNYTINYGNGTLTINAATLSITANNRSKTYGQTVTFAGTEFASAGLLNSDTVSSVTLTSLGASSSASVAGSPYAIVPSAAAGTGLGNYAIGYANGTLTVIGSGVTVTWNNPAAITYGAAISSSQLNATASVPGTFVYTPTNNSVLNSGINPLTVVFTPTDTVDYSSVTDTVSLAVQPAPLTVTAASYSRPFNTANPIFTGTINGLVNSDNISAIYSCGATPSTPLGSYAITPILVDPGNRQTNYSVTLVNGALSIVQGAPVVTWANPQPIIYGSALGGSQLNATANVPGEFTYTPTNGSVLNSGSNGLSAIFTPDDPVDYSSASNTVGLIVGPANLTVTADSFSRPFDTANPVFTGTLIGVVNGDNMTATYNSTATIASPVGTYPITPTLVDPANRETNYNVSLVNGILVVGHPTEVFSWTTPDPVVYGTPLGAIQLDASVNVIGTYAYSPTNGTVLNTGTNTLTVVFTPSDTVDYTGFTNSVNLVVTPAPLTITGAVTNRQYGLSNPALMGTISGVTNGDNITDTFSCSATVTSPVGPYAIVPGTAVGADLTNYLITYVNGSLTVNSAALTVTANNRAKTYGQAAGFSGTEFTVSGLLNSDSVTKVTLASSGAAASAAVSGSPYAINPSAAIGSGLANYTITYAVGNLTVSPAGLTVTANNQGKTYGQAVAFGSGSALFTSSALQNGETIGSVTLSVNNNGGAANAPVSGSPYVITPSAAAGGTFSPGNYSIAYAGGSLTVNPAALTITASSRSKTYGQTVTFAGTEFATLGLLNSDSVGGVTLSSSGAAATAGVAGSPYSIVPSGASGTGLGNYTISYNSGTLTVNRAGLTVTANNRSKTYGQTVSFAGTEFTTLGLLNGDTVTSASISSSGAAATAAVSGSPYAIVPSAATGTGLGNYTINYGNGTLTINAATLSITANNRSKTYGQTVTFAGTEFTTIGLLNSDSVGGVTLSSSGAAATATVAGSPYAIVPSAATGTGLGNYLINYGSGTLTINAATLSITANNRSKTYGQTVTFAGTEFTTIGLLNSDSVGGVTLSSSGAATTAAVAGSPYSIVPSAATGTGLGNYLINYGSGTLTVNRAGLTVTANNRSKTYGQTVTFAGTEFTTLGLLNSDSVGGVTLSSSGAAATAAVAGSPYSIAPSAATGTGLGNYTINYGNGTLTINAATLSITANNRTKTYGQTVTFAGTEFTTLGLLNSDSVGAVTLSSSGAAATAAVSGSPYAIVPSAATGTGLGNYTINYGNGTLTINPATLSITANNRSKTYGQTVTFAGTEFTTLGLLNSDTVSSVTLSSLGASSSAAAAGSPYAIVPSAATGTGLGNYTISYGNGTLTINPATLSITANNRSKTYGQTVTFAGTEFTTIGLLNSDTVSSVTLSSLGASASASVAGSPYAIVPSAATGTGLGNYTINYGNGTLTINPATLSITANNRSKTYGQTVTFAGTEFTTLGLLNSDSVGGVTLSSSGAAATAAVSGSPYAIVPSAAAGTGLNNYTINYGNGTLTINAATLSITANNRSKTYGQTVTFAGTEFASAGLLNSDTVSSVTLTSLGASSSASVAGSPYAIVPSAAAGTGLGNYAIGYANGTLTVIGSGVTVTWNNPAAIAYGAAISSSQLNATASVPGTFVYTPTNNSVLNSGINPLTVVFTPTDTVDYSSVTDTVSLAVQPAPLTVTAASYSRPFNTANPVFTGTINGLVNSDNISAIYASTATVSSPVGTYPTVPSLVDPNNRRTNYAVNLVNGILVVGHPAQVNTWTNPAPIIYGTPLSFVQLNESVNVVGTYAYSPPTGTVLNTGTNTLSVIFTPSDPIDYISVTDSVSLVVLPAPLTITAANTSRQYGQANPVFVGTMTGVTNGDNITDTYASGATTASPVGTYTIFPGPAAGNDLTNYSITYVNGTLTITPASLTVTANSRTKSYGQSASFAGTEFTTSGLLNGDTVSRANLTSSGASPTATVAGSPYAIVPGAATGSGLGNYSITYANGTLTVSPAGLMITANNQTKTFGQTVNFTGTEFTASGLFNGDSVIGVSLVSAGSAGTASVAGSPYVISASAANGSGLGNYTITYVGGRLIVLEATPIVSWPNPDPIVYGTDLDTNELNATASVPGNFTYTPTNGTVLNSGSNTLSVVFTPSDPADYTPVTATVSLTVLPAPLTVTADSFSRSFEADNPVFTGTIDGLTNGDVISASYSCAAEFSSPVGTYPIVPGLIDPGNRATNYSVNLVDGILVVGHPVEAFNWTNPAPIVYGTPLSLVQLNASVNVLGDYAYSPTNGTVLNTGTNVLSVIFTPSDTFDYTSVTDTVSVVVTPAPLSIAGPAESRQYGQANPDLTGTITGLTNGDDITVAFTSPVNSSSPVGTYAIFPGLATGSDLTNYTISYANGSLTVTPAALNITANNRTKVYGQGLVFLGTEFTATGLVNGDSVSSVSLSSSGATANSPVAGSPYVIIPSAAGGIGLANYTITYANGSLVINPAALSITANNRSKTYGQTVIFAGTEFTTAGLLNGDSVGGVTLSSSGVAAAATTAGSPYAIVPSAARGTGLGNYTINYGNGMLTVNPATLSITANNRSKTYGQAVAFARTEFTTAGLLNGDSVGGVTLSSLGAASAATTAGSPYAIIPIAATGTGLGNYIIDYGNGTLTVNRAGLTVTANGRSKTYGQTVTFTGTEFTTAGLLNGDTVASANISTSGAAATATVSGSPYSIVSSAAIGSGLANYTITYINGSLLVNPAALTITANNENKILGQIFLFAGTEFTSKGLVNGDTITSVTLTSPGVPASATLAESPYAIVPSAAEGVGLANYAISYFNGAMTVSSGSQPVIQSATRSGDSIIFNWSTAASQSYQIQYTTNLAGNQWIDLGGPVTATNSSAAATVSITNSQTFYRLLLLP